jgi:chromosome segregation protein
VAWALDRVKARENVASVVFQLLGNVCIAPDLETAIRLKREMPDVAFATMGGEFICAAGTIRGGAKSGAADSILQRQAQLRQLDVDVVELEKALAVLESEQSGLQKRQQELRSEVVEKREFLQIRRTSESALLGQLGQVHRETAAFASKFESIQWEYSELMKRQEALSRKIDEATSRRNRAEEEMETCRTLASTAVDALELKRREETEAFDHLNDTKTTLAVDQRHLQALQEQQGPMETRRREIEESLSKRRRDIEAHQEKITTAQEETDHLTSSVEEARTQVEELSHVLESRSAERSVRAQDLAQRDSALSGLRKQVSKLAEQRGNEEVRCTQLGLRVENLLNSAQERYRVNLEAFEVDAHALLSSINSQKAAQSRVDRRRGSLSVAEDEAGESPVAEVVASVDSVSDEDAAAFAEDGPDWDFVEGCIAELRQRLDSMGPVNLDAIQEFEELEERFNFLQKEYDDLVNAKTELMQIIAQINNESKRRFVETFVKVRDNFRNTFKELFGQGGQADLIIADEEDPLESGIEIIAKPPGKKPQSITLLSGGERSMTAVALMFSIYMVKPSPFCILDELDAPLDESNIGRFVRMLDKFIENSQFVIVTHNKRTMRRADVLYGVTMEEFGVSKPIGMRMSDTEKTEIQEQEERLLAEAAAKAAEEEAKLSAEDRQIKPVRTGTTNSWVEAMSET